MSRQWYPTCKVRLSIRPETFRPTPTISKTLSTANVGDIEGVEAAAANEFQQLSHDFVPFTANITRNSYREADTATITIPFRYLPIDPRVIRAASIQIFCGAVGYSVFDQNMNAEDELDMLVDVDPQSAARDPNGLPIPNEIFRGFVDSVKVEQQGDDVVTIEARDLTQYFIDAEMPTDGLARIPKDLPLDEVIKQIILGENTADQLSRVPPERWRTAAHATPKGVLQNAYKRRDAISNSLGRLNSKVASLRGNRLIAAQEKIAELTLQLQVENEVIATVRPDVELDSSVHILAKRFGLPGARGVKVVNESKVYPVLPTLAGLKGAKYLDSKGTGKRAKSSGSGEDISYWDFITDLCVDAGLICYMRSPLNTTLTSEQKHPELVITDSRTYYANRASNDFEDKYIHRFIYGNNVDSVEIERELSGKNMPTTVAVGVIEQETSRIEVFYYPPLKNKKDPGVTPVEANRYGITANSGDKEEIFRFNVNTKVPKSMIETVGKEKAKRIYQELARGEFKIKVNTHEMAFKDVSVQRPDPPADIFDLVAGDTIIVDVNPVQETAFTYVEEQNVVGSPTQFGVFNALQPADKTEHMMKLGFSGAMAAAVTAAYEQDRFPNRYRVSSVNIEFDHNSGYSFEVAAVNYLDIRDLEEN